MGFILPTLGVSIGQRGISLRFRFPFDNHPWASRSEWDPLVGIHHANVGTLARMGLHPAVFGLGILVCILDVCIYIPEVP